jgi:unsaturated rhamnogalacturonyl hydrolase
MLLFVVSFAIANNRRDNKVLINRVSQSKEFLITDTLKWSERMALSEMKRYPKAWQIDNNGKPKWDYKPSFILFSIENLYNQTKNSTYQNYIKEYVDAFIDSSGSLSHYELQEYNIDLLNPGKLLFELYNRTQDVRYLKVMQLLKRQLEVQPRTKSAGFWHKNIYPNQMWLDGLYMGTPFYTRYTVTYEGGKNLDDVAKQFEVVQEHLLDKKAGLPYHAWDESKQIPWANINTGTSPTLWSRGIGWYAMALVDVLDYYPKNHPKQKVIVRYLNELVENLAKYQDASGLWYQVIDKGNKEGNYLESSGSAMFTYVMAKGVEKGYLPKKYKRLANKAFDGITKKLINVGEDGEIHLTQVCSNFGLGGTPFRDGSYEFYTKAAGKEDGSVGVGAFILAAIELDK